MNELPAEPRADDAEKAVIGCMITDNHAAQAAEEMLGADEFGNADCAALFGAACVLLRDGLPLEPMSLSAQLAKTGFRELKELVYECFDLVGAASSVEYYCNLVKSASARRRLYRLAADILRTVGDRDAHEALDEVGRKLAEVESQYMSNGREAEDLGESSDAVIDDLLKGDPRELWGLPTGIAGGAFDRLTGGIQTGYWVLAARPHIGKSTFLNALMRSFVSVNPDKGKPLYCYTEGGRGAFINAALAGEVQATVKQIKQRRLSEKQRAKLGDITRRRLLDGIRFLHTGGMGLRELESICKRHKREHGLPLVLIDMASGLSCDARVDGEKDRISHITRGLQSMASRHDICVIATYHLNRDTRNNDGGVPQLHNLRDSGEIEQNADKVLFLHRPMRAGDTRFRSDVTEIIQAKDREVGDTDERICVEWKKATGRYENITEAVAAGIPEL